MNPTTILAIYNFRMRTSLVRFLWNIASNRGMADYAPSGPAALPTGQVGGTWRDASANEDKLVSSLDAEQSGSADNHLSPQDYDYRRSA